MLLTTPAAELWLSQFNDDDELRLARRLLSKFRLVDSNELTRVFSAALEALSLSGPIAVYIERELPHHWRNLVHVRTRWSMAGGRRTRLAPVTARRLEKLPLRMYKEKAISRGRGVPKRLRAEGAALPAIASRRSDRQDFGSEAAIALIASMVARRFRNVFVHPSTTQLRRKKIRRAVILTDFIGSGTRGCQMLESLWHVRSFRSWWSGGQMHPSVLAFAGTAAGCEKVRGHPSNPVVTCLTSCPTIENQFSGVERRAIEGLCQRKAPDSERPLGFGDAGALIAFEHSCPNNVPAIFVETDIRRASAWTPLFPKRTTAEIFRTIGSPQRRERDRIALETLRMEKISEGSAFARMGEGRRNLALLLAALARGHRTLDELAATSLLQAPELAVALEQARGSGLVSGWRLTPAGHALLRRLARSSRSTADPAKPLYYPKSLRSLG